MQSFVGNFEGINHRYFNRKQYRYLHLIPRKLNQFLNRVKALCLLCDGFNCGILSSCALYFGLHSLEAKVNSNNESNPPCHKRNNMFIHLTITCLWRSGKQLLSLFSNSTLFEEYFRLREGDIAFQAEKRVRANWMNNGTMRIKCWERIY